MTEKTIEQLLNEWLEVYVKPCRKEKTYQCYKYTVKRILKYRPEYKETGLTQIKESDIQIFINSMVQIYAKSTLNDIRVVFHQAYAAAVRNNICPYNPVGHIVIPENAAQKKVRALTRREQALVEQAAASDPLGHIVRFFLCTGIRSGELCNLKWEDYDSEKGCIHINKSKTKAGIRTIPLLPQAKSIIDSQPHFCDYIFTSTVHHAVTPTVLKKLYVRIRKATGLDFITTHVYRHSFATRLVENGVDYKALSALLGHTDVAFTLQRYTSAEDDFLREQISLLNKSKAS